MTDDTDPKEAHRIGTINRWDPPEEREQRKQGRRKEQNESLGDFA